MIKAEWTNADALDLQPTCNQLTTDTISRQDAIDAIHCDITVTGKRNAEIVASTIGTFVDRIKALPSAQPEITRCRDCKYRDEKWRRTSVRWLPCMNVRTGGNWYCGSAERGEQNERLNQQTGGY